MKYYLDTEFIENFKKPIKWLPTIGSFNKPYHFIDLISIGIKAEDGREYYAVCNEFNPNDADEWVKENVIKPIYDEDEQIHYDRAKHIPGLCYEYREYTAKRFKSLFKRKGKSKSEIRRDIVFFMGGDIDDIASCFYVPKDIEIYAYYADYDWVVFCGMFGRMINLPSGMPMYCKDLKQILDEYADRYDDHFTGAESQQAKLSWIKNKDTFPKQENEHNALDDAKWNKKLHEFLLSAK